MSDALHGLKSNPFQQEQEKMKRIVLILMLIIFISGCTKEVTEETLEDEGQGITTEEVEEYPTEQPDQEEILPEKTPAEETEQAESQATEIDCTDYDKNQEECLKHKKCEWISEEQLCENPKGIEEKTLSEQWATETADDSGWVGIDSCIALDSNRNPHISHFDAKNKDLKYAYKKEDAWLREVVDSKGHVGEESAITIDNEGNVHISYNDATNGVLKYAKKTGGSWSIETVDKKGGYHVVTTSLALDATGNPRIAYNMESPNLDLVKFASWNGNSWKIEEAATGGIDVDLALDSNGNPHIAFVKGDQATKKIYYTQKISGAWKTEIVDSLTIVGGDCGIDIDSKNYPHITYHDYGISAIKYAKFDGTSWQTQTVAVDIGKQEGLRLAIDSRDNPHIVYVDTEKEKLMHAFFDGKSWTKEIVSKMGIPSIVIDSLDNVHVSHGATSDKETTDLDAGEIIEILKYSVRK